MARYPCQAQTFDQLLRALAAVSFRQELHMHMWENLRHFNLAYTGKFRSVKLLSSHELSVAATLQLRMRKSSTLSCPITPVT